MVDKWEDVARIVRVATDIADLLTKLISTRKVERVAHILPVLRASLEKVHADLKAAIKYGSRS